MVASAVARAVASASRYRSGRSTAIVTVRSRGAESGDSSARRYRYAASQAPSASPRTAEGSAPAGTATVSDGSRRADRTAAAPAARQPASSPEPAPTRYTRPGRRSGRGSACSTPAAPVCSTSRRYASISSRPSTRSSTLTGARPAESSASSAASTGRVSRSGTVRSAASRTLSTGAPPGRDRGVRQYHVKDRACGQSIGFRRWLAVNGHRAVVDEGRCRRTRHPEQTGERDVQPLPVEPLGQRDRSLCGH